MSEMSGKSGKVYVANVTAQNHTINFRLPESRKPMAITIPMGQQKFIGDLSAPEIDAMVEQVGRYGLVEVGQENKREKVTFIFNVGSTIPAASIQKIYDRNRGILTDEGKKRRIENAVAANAAMNTEETPLTNFTADVEEIDSGDFGNDSDGVAEGVKIDNTAASSNENAPKRRSSRRGSGQG